MQELLKNAWEGWQLFISGGKLAAVLLALLVLYMLSSERQRKEKHAQLYFYTGALTILCICPLTAVCLMLYQTRFYDYYWIWSMVPMVLFIGYGIVTFLGDYWEQGKQTTGKKKEMSKGLALTALCLGVLFLCSGLGERTESLKNTGTIAETAEILDIISGGADASAGADTELCLWAPRQLMEDARLTGREVRLVYGRNMWDPALNAYSYDTYPTEVETLYQWMELTEDPQETQEVYENAQTCAELAMTCGVTGILLPNSLETRTLERLEETLQAVAEPVGDYLFLRCDG